jgi:hypothetical protein
MGRGSQDLRDGAAFHDATGIHDVDEVGNLGHERQVVGYEQDGHVELGLQGSHQFQDLGLNGDIERGGRLVRNQQLGATGQGHCQHGALQHAPAQLVGVGPQAGLRVGQAYESQNVQGSAAYV